MNQTIDILDKLQEEEGYVRLVLRSGEIVFGRPQCIVYDEDDEGWETVKTLMFELWESRKMTFYKPEDIESYDQCKVKDIPPYE